MRDFKSVHVRYCPCVRANIQIATYFSSDGVKGVQCLHEEICIEERGGCANARIACLRANTMAAV